MESSMKEHLLRILDLIGDQQKQIEEIRVVIAAIDEVQESYYKEISEGLAAIRRVSVPEVSEGGE